MNWKMAFAVVLIIAVAAGAAVMGLDAADDGGIEDTYVDNEVFQVPYAADGSMGSVEMEGYLSWDEVTFTAVPSQGYSFDRWAYASDGSTYSESISFTVPIGSVPDVVAYFVPLEGNKVVTLEWDMPAFDGDDIEVVAVTHDSFSVAIDSAEWWESVYGDGDTQRHATSDVLVPSALVVCDGVVDAIADHLEPMMAGLTDTQRAIAVMYFVQDAIDYREDISLYGESEFWALPMETVYSLEGDCEDTSTLYVAIASVLGLQAGFVSFEDPSAGHMGAAVAIVDGAPVSGNGVFGIDGTTYAFVETTSDGYNCPLGSLGTYQGGVTFDIDDGKWTPLFYEEGTFTSGATAPIAGSSDPATQYGVVYGSFSEPPSIPLGVGDTFLYVPTTSLPSEIAASGDGLVSEGGFLIWDAEANELSGTAVEEGTYTVTLSASWTHGELEQTATQTIVFTVSSSAPDYSGEDVELVYSAATGEWNIVTTEPVSPERDNSVLWMAAGALAVIVAGLLIWRTVA